MFTVELRGWVAKCINTHISITTSIMGTHWFDGDNDFFLVLAGTLADVKVVVHKS